MGLENKPLVMVVDDDTRVLRGLEISLKSKFTVLTFSRAAFAIRDIDRRVQLESQGLTDAAGPVHALILDIKMPEMDGFAAFKEIRKRLSRVPIIFNSAYQDQEHPDAVQYQYGPYGYVSKGSNFKVFVDLVQKAVSEHAAYLARTGNV